MYFEGQGKLYVATATNGVPGPFRWCADVNELELQGEVENEEVFESYSGQNLLALRLAKQKTLNVSFNLREWLIDNLAMAFYGTSATIAAGSVTSEALPATLAKGDIARLEHQQVKTVVLTDSAMAALTEGTDYTVNADFGHVEIISDLSTYTLPITAAYDYQGGKNVTMFTQPAQERWLRFEGLNRADSNAPVLVELYRVRTDPTSSAGLISDEVADLAIEGGVLYDSNNESNSELGGFGRIIQVAAAA